jgi:outer membrane protein OmpA-like peptidoglycan-associated protein
MLDRMIVARRRVGSVFPAPRVLLCLTAVLAFSACSAGNQPDFEPIEEEVVVVPFEPEFEAPALDPNRDLNEEEPAVPLLTEEDEHVMAYLRERGLQVRAAERGLIITLPDLFFQFGSSKLTGSARKRVRDIADVLNREARGRRLIVEGHTDAIGAELYNQALSERRARSVFRLLADYGIAEALIVWKGYGSRFPIVPNEHEDGSDDPEGRAHNRRVEIVIEY